MVVRIRCSCGQSLEVDSSLSGRQITCPGCGRLHVVPPPVRSASPDPQPRAPPAPSTSPLIDPEAQAGEAGKPRPRDRSWLPIAGSIAAIVLLGTVLLWALGDVGPGSGGTGSGDGMGTVAAGEGRGAGEEGDHLGAARQDTRPEGHATSAPAKPTTQAVTMKPVDHPKPGFAEPVEIPNLPPAAPTGKAGAGSDGTIFDRKGRGTRFVYVIDFSSSMTGPRFEAAKGELIASIKNLRENMEFYVIFYDSTHEPIDKKERLIKATPENKKWAIGQIQSTQTRGGTNPSSAMDLALKLKPHTVFLLSDGQFDPAVAGEVRKGNPDKKVSICTIAFHDSGGEPVLKRIAQENNGDYRFVPPPDRRSR